MELATSEEEQVLDAAQVNWLYSGRPEQRQLSSAQPGALYSADCAQHLQPFVSEADLSPSWTVRFAMMSVDVQWLQRRCLSSVRH